MIEEVSQLWAWWHDRPSTVSVLLLCMAFLGLGLLTLHLASGERRRWTAIFASLLTAAALVLAVTLWGEPETREAERTHIEARGTVAVSTTSGLEEGYIGIRLEGARDVLLLTEDQALAGSEGLSVTLYCDTSRGLFGSEDPRILYCDRDPGRTDRAPDPAAEVVRESRSPYSVAD